MIDFHALEMTSINGEPVDFERYRGSVCLVVNVASRCGLTPQYAGLRALQDAYGDRGFTVLAFPCNQFGGQEPGSDAQVCEFATSRYQANFPMFSKIEVNGPGTCDLYRLLKSSMADEEGRGDIPWNFTKFLVDGDGSVVARFAPTVTPEEIGVHLEQIL
jgi:glutathione peroxidase